VPDASVKRPRTLVPMRWRAIKPTSVWAGSMVYTPALGRVAVLVVLVMLVIFVLLG